MSISCKSKEILSAIRGVSARPLANECAILEEIGNVMQRVSDEQFSSDPKAQMDSCIRDLGLIYARHTGLRPAYTNSDCGTRFERFVQSIPLPVHFQATPSAIKASIRRLDPSRNPIFSHRDVSTIEMNRGRDLNIRLPADEITDKN